MPKRSKRTDAQAEELARDAAQAFAAFAQQGRGLLESAIRTWGDETHALMEGMTRDSIAAFERLQACKTPMEMLAVEQAWLMARTRAYLDAGHRVLETALANVGRPANEAPGFRLPE